MSETLPYEKFPPLVNSRFHVHDGAGMTYELTLVSVTENRVSPELEQFSLIFAGGPDFYLPQGMYGVDHTTIALFDLFLVPVGQDANGYTYEAVFSRLRTTT